MKLRILGITLLAASAAACAQTQSGSAIGSNTGGSGSVQPRPLPQPLPSTGTSADTGGEQGTGMRGAPSTYGSNDSVLGAPTARPGSGPCDSLIGDERSKCLRDQANGSAGAGSTGMGSGSSTR